MPADPFYEQRAPRCYRRPRATIAAHSRIEGSAVFLALSLFTAITVFLLAYRSLL